MIILLIFKETSSVGDTFLLGEPSNIQESSVVVAENDDYMGHSSRLELQENTNIQTPYNQQPAFVDDEQPILKFDSYDDFKIAMNEYQTKTVTKFVSRNKTKDFSLQG